MADQANGSSGGSDYDGGKVPATRVGPDSPLRLTRLGSGNGQTNSTNTRRVAAAGFGIAGAVLTAAGGGGMAGHQLGQQASVDAAGERFTVSPEIDAATSAANGELIGSIREIGNTARELARASMDAGLAPEQMGVHVPRHPEGSVHSGEFRTAAEQQSSVNEAELHNLAQSHDQLRRELGMPGFDVGADFSGTNGKPTVINWSGEESGLAETVADTLDRHRQVADNLSEGLQGIAIHLEQNGAEVDAAETRVSLQSVVPDKGAWSQRTDNIREAGQQAQESGQAAAQPIANEVSRVVSGPVDDAVTSAAVTTMDAPVKPGQIAEGNTGRTESVRPDGPAADPSQRKGAVA